MEAWWPVRIGLQHSIDGGLENMTVNYGERMPNLTIRGMYDVPGYTSGTLLSPAPKDEVVRKREHLFFVERNGRRYAVLAQSSDDALGSVEWLGRKESDA